MNKTFVDMFNKQAENQREMINAGTYDGVADVEYGCELPIDNTRMASYHVQQLVSEIGEVLSSDKRWKNMRNNHNCPENKLEEIADCIIVGMNIAMYSGFTGEQLEEAIFKKIDTVADRVAEEKAKR
jgi:hypothetical protein|nr:MAG TPA: pyrophosphatase [Caudoviricetes sp.]